VLEVPPPLPSARASFPGLPPWMPLLVVAMAWAAQGGVLRNGWVWDDAILVRDGSAVARGLAAIPSLLFGTWGGGDGIDVGLYRPFVGASLAVQASIHGVADPFPYHLLNLFVHGGVAVAFLALLHRLLPTRPVVTATAALVFAAHPLHTGTVSWIVARGDLLAALFCLLAALAWTRPRGLDLAAVLLTAVLWFLALLSKEMAVTLPLVLLGIDAWGRGRGVRAALAERWKGYAALVLPLAGYVALRRHAVGGFVPEATAPLAGRAFLERVFVGSGALVRMAAKLAVPTGITGDASNDPVLASAHADLPFAYVLAFAGVVTLLLAAGVRRLRGRGGLATFSLVAFVVVSLPVLQLVPIGAVFEDRFAYLPSLALLPLLGLAAERLWTASPRIVGRTLLAVALATLVPASWAVAATWRDEAAFDRALLEDDPGHLKALDRLSRELLVAGLRERRADEALPGTPPKVHRPLQAASVEHVAEALRLLERAHVGGAGRNNPSVLRSLGDAYLAQPTPRFGEAVLTYHDLLAIKRVRVAGRWVPWEQVPDIARVLPADRAAMAEIYDNLARAETGVAATEMLDRVAQARELAARWTPDDYERARLAGAAWLAVDDPARALVRLERAARSAPASQSVAARAALTEAREAARRRAEAAFDEGTAANHKAGAQTEALRAFEEAVRIDPAFAAAHVERARLLRYKGDFQGALEALRAATASMDAAKVRPDAQDRKLVQALVAQYEKEMLEDPEAPKQPGADKPK